MIGPAVRALAILAACLLAVIGALPAAAQMPRIRLQEVIAGLTAPVYLTHAGDGSGRLFIVEQAGVIRILVSGVLLPTPFLDLRDRVTSGGEKGLLSVAFHPNYDVNGQFFVNYTTNLNGGLRTVVSEFRAWPPSSNTAEPFERIILEVRQPYDNHNGGLNLFGPDGKLYIGLGDGGSGGDPHNYGQRLDTLLGKILRVDVDGGIPYGVPTDNPFVGRANVRPEIWAYGFRNPWRFAFDPKNGRMFVGDVGQSAWEEISFVERGRNYGWRIMEGAHCYKPPTGCPTSGLQLPKAEYSHTLGCSVTAGFMYRGTGFPALRGHFVFGDYCTGLIWSLSGGGPWTLAQLLDSPARISSFGLDQAGELYVVDHQGRIYKIVSAP
jgi:glucose/arabinose dehydrogenase